VRLAKGGRCVLRMPAASSVAARVQAAEAMAKQLDQLPEAEATVVRRTPDEAKKAKQKAKRSAKTKAAAKGQRADGVALAKKEEEKELEKATTEVSAPPPRGGGGRAGVAAHG
jgi:hypothetical protein